jgi:hypothetical protein
MIQTQNGLVKQITFPFVYKKDTFHFHFSLHYFLPTHYGPLMQDFALLIWQQVTRLP